MSEAAAFYEDLAKRYHLLFDDWDAAVGFREVAWRMPDEGRLSRCRA